MERLIYKIYFNIIMKSVLKLFLLILIFSNSVKSQTLSPKTIVSLITCDEGTEIYSLFGHSAIRIQDPFNHIDFVYNWGMFEFGDSELDFQFRFAKGKLKYYMAEELYENFIYSYQYEQRTVREQVLNLSYQQKLALWDEIQFNYRPENRYYQYDFFFDNCSSRISDIFEKVLGDNLIRKELPLANQLTYRQLIDKQVSISQPWSDFGIDLALGSKIDKLTTSKEMQFLPKYLEQSIGLASIKLDNGNVEPLVLAVHELEKGKSYIDGDKESWSPLFICWGIFFVALLLHLVNIKYLTSTFDALLFFSFGIGGVVLVFLWFFTDHQPTKLNYNLLWLNPLHFIALISIFSKKLQFLFNKFYLVQAFFHFGIVLFWIAIPQEFNPAFRPLLLILVLLYYFWYKKTVPKKA